MRRLDHIIPPYARPWLLGMLGMNLFAYFGTRSVSTGLHHTMMTSNLDQMIPLVTIFVIPYIIAYFQWAVGYVMICKDSYAYCRYICTGEMVAKIIAGIFFVLLPTTLIRPEITGGDVFSALTALIYRLDAPDNLFPSIHCLESYICMRATLPMRSVSRSYKIGMAIMTVLVFLSTVFLKQHVVADMIGAVAVAEIGFGVSDILQRIRCARRESMAER